MRRRELIAGLGGAVAWPFARPLAVEAQRRLSALLFGRDDDPLYHSVWGAFREGLATFGWVEGRNLRIDYRFAGDPSGLAADAEELVNLRPDVIFAGTGPAARAVQQRTSVIPIVFMGGGDPASNGMVRDIARPEGNMTGFANSYGSLGGRWLELFKEAVPRLTRVADMTGVADIFFAMGDLSARNDVRATIATAAAQLGVTIIRMPVRNAVEIEHAISAFAAEPDGGLLVTPVNPVSLEVIGRLALYHHLPLMVGGGSGRPRPEGMLLAHGPDGHDLVRRASSYVDRILRGAKPSELPVQYPTKFELVVNLKTAKSIGVTIPETFLARADEVIE
jgi:putative tryptophan/tyrosine transport system substrate-binding protein